MSTQTTQKKALPYGSWPSPISSSFLASSVISIPQIIPSKSQIYHIEGRPSEGGRNLVVNTRTGQEITPKEFNVRTRVHEYGGGAAAISVKDDTESLVFSEFQGNGVFEITKKGDGNSKDEWSRAERIVAESTVLRYANFSYHPTDPSYILAIQEDHTKPAPADVVNTVVLIDKKAGNVTTLVSGADFYSYPRWSHDGEWISWTEWNHPYMPWSSSTLKVAKVSTSTGALDSSSITKIAGSIDATEAVSQPQWSTHPSSPDQRVLYFLSDRTGYSDIYRWNQDDGKVEKLLAREATFDIGGPDWQFGQSTYTILSPTTLAVRTSSTSISILTYQSSSASPQTRNIVTPFRTISQVRTQSSTSLVLGGSPSKAPGAVYHLDISSPESPKFTLLKETSSEKIDEGYLSEAVEIEYPVKSDPPKSKEGKAEEEAQTAFALFYPPQNKDHAGEDGSKPPVVVRAHGGPTGAASPGLDFGIQFYTSRGFAYVDVNYGGSTGYGRRYRERLDGNWGITDVEDVRGCIDWLVKQGKVAQKGGFTVLASLVAHSDIFGAGASHFGVADLALLAADTHKFESQYLTTLIGGTISEIPEVYRERSPITHASNIKSPLIVLQGTEDKVVPPEQAETIVEKVKSGGGRVEYLLFEGEGHGFRQGKNVRKAAESELEWFRSVLGVQGGSA